MDEKYIYATITPLKQWKKTKSGTKRISNYVSLVFPRKKSIFTKLIKEQAFATNPGERLWDFLRQTAWVYITNLNPKIYPHMFRHSRATHLADRGIGDDQMKRWMGWSKDSKMPSRYVEYSRIQMSKIGEVLED